MPDPDRDLPAFLLGIAAVGVFGATLPMTRLALEHFDPWFLTAARGTLAGASGLAVLAALRRPPPPRALRARLAMAALVVVAGFPTLTALAMLTAPAAHGGVVLAALPLATALAGALLAGERPSPAFWACGMVGAGLVLAFSIARSDGPLLAAADLFLLAAMACAATGYALSGELARAMPGWEVISWMCVLALPAWLIALVLLWPGDVAAAPASALWAGAYLGIGSQYLGFFAWNAALALGGVARVGQIQLLQPFVTLLLAAWLLGEPVGPGTLAFASAVVVVVFVGRRLAVVRPRPA